MSSPPIFVEPGAPSPGDGGPVIVLASGRQRAAARLIDVVAVAMAMMAPQSLLMGGIIGLDGHEIPAGLMMAMALAALLVMIWLCLFLRVFRLVLWGCTVGQRIAGLRVVRLADLRFPGWKESFRRWQPTWGSHVSPGTGPWSDLLAYRRDERTRRCLHDRAAGTVVIRFAGDEPVRRALLAATLPVMGLAIVPGFLLIG
ncbi:MULTISPECIES: RDD family protein [unclassified Spirillospora]|uniref:RDD family protein n=1 Tax=unclassified Spirillospora TaxID=2642701 RepID=UPI003710F460